MIKLFIFHRMHIKRDFIVVFLILFSPFLFFLYSIAPKKLDEWKTFLFHYKLLNINYDIDEILWNISYYFLTLLVFCLWYLTCNHKWRYAILVPVFVELHKILVLFFDINNKLTDYKIYYSILIGFLLISILTFLSDKLNFYTLQKSINQQIDEEIESLMTEVSNFEKTKYRKFKRKLIQLRKEKINLDKNEYLTKLIKLREEYSA